MNRSAFIVTAIAIGLVTGAMGWIRQIPDETRCRRVQQDIILLQSSDEPQRTWDAWGNPFQLVSISGSKSEIGHKVFSMRPNERSGTFGEDVDDIGPSTQASEWVERRFNVSWWRYGFVVIAGLLCGSFLRFGKPRKIQVP